MALFCTGVDVSVSEADVHGRKFLQSLINRNFMGLK